ncbi:Sterol desaturase [Myxococcus hansupus]|uniref:Sterol desaturase n=1 Tax=Pseudomyxococcus hansupus TaxID=1297742 RepID=A0A0H4X3Y9_9BACT|nr:sterol desaturase family protein [Myxococcus hansupus]AKQ70396.1 Sterol desaturase [Myxococcus hansupus]
MPLAAIGGMVLSFVVLAILFWPLERAWAARPEQPLLRPGLRTDLAYFVAQYLVLAPLSLFVLSGVKTLCHTEALMGFQAAVASQPWWLQALEAVVLCDLLVYGFHRLSHQVDFLWRFHAVHHSAEHLDWLAAHREHPVDGLLTQMVVNLPALMMGFPLPTLAMLIVFRGMWAIFIHANVRLPLGPLGFLFGAPELHHWHHARERHTRHNFGNLAPWTDWLFGTYHRPTGPELYPLGLVEPFPRRFLAQLVSPVARTTDSSGTSRWPRLRSRRRGSAPPASSPRATS